MWLVCGKESITKLDKDMWSASWAEDAIEEEELCDRLFDYFSDENSLWCAGGALIRPHECSLPCHCRVTTLGQSRCWTVLLWKIRQAIRRR